MILKYKAGDSLKTDADKIGISDMMSGLETVNTSFDALYKTRNTQEAALSGPSASSLKAAAIKSYEQFCMAVELSVNHTPGEVFTALFNQMQELREKYALLLPRKEKKETPGV